MLKKLIPLLVVLTTFVFATSVMAQDVVEITFWTEWSAEPWKSLGDDLVAQFNAANPGIRVTHRTIENEQFFTVLRTAFASGDPPDVFQHEANNNLFQFVIPGEVEDITDWYEANGSRFVPGSETAVTYDGRVYGVPGGVATGTQIYYNAALLRDNGIDPAALVTWADYLAAFDTLKQRGITPIAYANKFGWPGSQWFYALLVRWVGAEKVNQLVARNCEYKWTDPDIVQAAQYYVDLANAGYFSSGMASDDYPAATALFFAGRAAFFHTGSWFIADASAEMPPGFELAMNEFPVFPDGADPEGTQAFASVLGGYSISKRGAELHREEALMFIDFITQLPQAQEGVRRTGSISSVVGAVTEETATPLVLQIISQQLDGNTGTIGFLEHITPKEVGEDAIWMGSVGVLTGQLTAEQWMQNVEDAAAATEPTLILPEQCE
jgi:raffinose/stachyose/melibiose transport system substrate-binding protein